MAKRLTEKEKDRIIRLLQAGNGSNQIAKKVGRSQDTVSRVAKSIDHTFGKTNQINAREARKAYCAEARAEFAKELHEIAKKVAAEDFTGEHLVFNFGGKDNDYNEHILNNPTIDAKLAAAKTVNTLYRTIMDITRYDDPKPQEITGKLTILDLMKSED